MQILKAPKISRVFWQFHIIGWSLLSLINFLNRQVFANESLEIGLVSAFLNLTVNVLVCMVFRELLHRWNILHIRWSMLWIFLLLGSAVSGFLTAMLIIYVLGTYYVIAGYSSEIIFFMDDVYANWMIMTISIFLWSVIYIGATTYLQLQKFREEHDMLNLKLKEAQLNALIGQLNPHFLFNGLNNIRGLMLENVDKSRQMLTHLSELLRYSLGSHKNTFSQIKQELQMVHSYLELAKIQYEERLHYQENVNSDLMNTKVPYLVIQLLIENAIRHGIDNSAAGGVLRLSVDEQTDKEDCRWLIIEVQNPGYLTRLNKSPECRPLNSNDTIEHTSTDRNRSQNKSNLPLERAQSTSTGIGINNIKKRLGILYGDKASLLLTESSGIVSAKLKIPLEK